ncbi:hypothetical protein GQ53DRAFT_863878 [Thozetella sp. PMI_491]|nr:hypothetical protein GQ53DRAFT_863878 [Thozetella sp. PMI_491]
MVPFHNWDDILDGEENLEEADVEWSRMFPVGNGIVALKDETVAQMQLPPSVKNPMEEYRSLYILAGYHSLHCLTLIRHAMFQYYLNQNAPITHIMEEGRWMHAKHCLSDLRQSLICNLDETLLAQPNNNAQPGDGQLIQCKNITTTVNWLKEHRHITQHPPGMGPNDSMALA